MVLENGDIKQSPEAEMKEEETKKNDTTEKQRNLVDDFRSKVKKLTDVTDKDAEVVSEIEKETKNRAKHLERKEDKKIKDLSNLLIDIQLSKLESKIQFLEEYERIIWSEKKQLEILQKLQMADRVQLVLKRNDTHKQQQQQPHPQPSPHNQMQSHQQQQQQQHYQQQSHSEASGGVANGPHVGQHSQHHSMMHRDDKIHTHGGTSNMNSNVDDMLNFGSMDKMDDDFGKGDHL